MLQIEVTIEPEQWYYLKEICEYDSYEYIFFSKQRSNYYDNDSTTLDLIHINGIDGSRMLCDERYYNEETDEYYITLNESCEKYILTKITDTVFSIFTTFSEGMNKNG